MCFKCLTFFLLCLPLQAFVFTGNGNWASNGNVGGSYETYILQSGTTWLSAYYDTYGKYIREISCDNHEKPDQILVNEKFIGTFFCHENLCVFEWIEHDDEMKEIWELNRGSLKRVGQRKGNSWISKWSDTQIVEGKLIPIQLEFCN